MNSAKAHAKARAAMKRREEQIEQDELEGGEINLIPYLDIVTNLMLFLLASISSGLVLGQLNTQLPDAAMTDQTSEQPPSTPPEQRNLQIKVWITDQNLRLAADVPEAGLGNEENPALTLPRLPPQADPKTGVVDPIWHYDYRPLNDKLYEVAKRWKGKTRSYPTYRITLLGDPYVPYGTIVEVMDAVRCKLPPPGEIPKPCMLPRVAQGEDGMPLMDPELNVPVMIGPDGKKLENDYDPDTMALFHFISFARLE